MGALFIINDVVMLLLGITNIINTMTLNKLIVSHDIVVDRIDWIAENLQQNRNLAHLTNRQIADLAARIPQQRASETVDA